MPKLLPDPLGRAVTTPPLAVTEAFQEFWMLWPPLGVMRTTQLFVPLTE